MCPFSFAWELSNPPSVWKYGSIPAPDYMALLVSGQRSFFFTGVEPTDTLQPAPSLTFEYLPRIVPGEYSLVVRAIWEGPIDVFYAISFGLGDFSDQEPGPTPSGVVPAEEAFKALLTLFDVEKLLTTAVRLNTDVTDFKAMAEVVDPAQVQNMDSFYVLSFQTEDRMKGMTFSVIDFDSEASAQGHFEKVNSETPGMQDMDSPIGDASVEVEVNAQGVGSMLVFIKGDNLVMLHTAQPDDQEPLLSLEGLEELAKVVASRL